MLEIRKGGHRDLEKYYALMEVDFDEKELLSKLSIHRAMMNGAMELLIFSERESGMDFAYALVGTKNIYGYVLLKYFAVFPWYRGKGLGVEAMRLLNRRFTDCQGIIAELTEFEDEYPNHLGKLIKFFARFGYEEVQREYRIGGTRAHLFIKPVKAKTDAAPIADRVLADFYSRCLNAFQMEKYMQIQ